MVFYYNVDITKLTAQYAGVCACVCVVEINKLKFMLVISGVVRLCVWSGWCV